jgi:hypothetical protein
VDLSWIEPAGKKFELLRAPLPRLSRVAFLAHGGDPVYWLFVQRAQDAASAAEQCVMPTAVRDDGSPDGESPDLD